MPWTTEDLKRLVELEAHLQNVDPRLAMAVVSQESEWNPNAVGDNGNSIGLFQLQPAVAKDAGLHPRFRSDPAENIKAGVTYLGQKLKQSGGNVEQALSRYNRGTPDYRGIGDPNYVQNVLRYYPDYQPPAAQKPGMLARVASALGPASAEASPAPSSTGMSRLQELEAHLARLEGQQPPAEAATPTAQPQPRTRLEELEAELARREGQPPAQATAPTAPAPAPVPAQPPAEEPPSDITVDIEKPSPPAPTGWRAQLPQTTEQWDKAMAPMRETTEATSRAAIPMALSVVPGGLGYALGAKLAPSLGAVGKVVPPLLEAAGGYLGHRVNVKLGNEQEGPLGDVMSALPLAVRALGTGTARWLESAISEAPVAARDQTMDLLSKLFSRGGAQGTLTYLLSGDPQLAAWVAGSYATVRSLLGFALRSDIGKQLVETTLKAGRAIGGPELGMLLHIGKTGKLPEGWGG